MHDKTIGGFLLGTIFGLFLGLGLFGSPQAHADPDSAVYAYAATFGGAVCDVLDEYPTFGGIQGIGQAIVEDGYTYAQAGQIVGIAVIEICPRHIPLMNRFVAAYGHTARQIA